MNPILKLVIITVPTILILRKRAPSLYIESGEDVIGKDAGYGKALADEYRDKHYHRPSDEYNPKWVLDGAIADLQLLFEVGKRLAFTDTFPKWKDGSEFKTIPEKQ